MNHGKNDTENVFTLGKVDNALAPGRGQDLLSWKILSNEDLRLVKTAILASERPSDSSSLLFCHFFSLFS